MCGAPGCPAAGAELGEPSIRSGFSCKRRTDARMWPQAVNGCAGVTCFHPVSDLIIRCLCSQVAYVMAGILDFVSSLVLIRCARLSVNFLPCFIFCLFVSFISKWKFQYQTPRDTAHLPSCLEECLPGACREG